VLPVRSSRGGKSPVLPEREESSKWVPEEEGVELRRTADGKGDGVMATRPFAVGEIVMVGFLVGGLTGNDSYATQVGPGRWALHGGLGPKVNHSCDPNCGVRLNDGQAFDFVARQPIGAGQELTFDYAMRNFTIDHFPAVCLCGAAGCRGSVTGWKDLPAARKADYGELVAPYLRTMDDEIRRGTAPVGGVGRGEAGAGLYLSGAKMCFCLVLALEGTDLDQPATAGASYRKTRLACFDLARRGPGGLDVVSRSRISRMHFC